jgi:hypothetical protein
MKRTDIIKLKELISRGWEINEEEGTVKNPITGKAIKISTALGYDKNHPAYKAAVKAQGDKDLGSDNGGEDSDTDKSDASDNPTSKFLSDTDGNISAFYDKLEKLSDDELNKLGATLKKGAEMAERFSDESQDAFDSIDSFFDGNKRNEYGTVLWNTLESDEDRKTLQDIDKKLKAHMGGEILDGIQQYQEFSKKHPGVKSYISDDELKNLYGMATKLKKADDNVAAVEARFAGLSAREIQKHVDAVEEEQYGRENPNESINNMKQELEKLQEALTQVQKYQMDEPDHEGEMAKSQMLKTMKYAADIMNMIDDSSNLPAWVQSKLTKIADYIGAVKHYMDSKTVRHVVTNMGEGVERKSEEIRLVDMVPLNAKNKSVNEDKPPKGVDLSKIDKEIKRRGKDNMLKHFQDIKKNKLYTKVNTPNSIDYLINYVSNFNESVNEDKDNFMNESYVSWDTSLSSLVKDTNNLRSYVNDIKNPKTKRNSLTKVKAIQKHLQTIENLFSDIDKDIDDDELSRGKFK